MGTLRITLLFSLVVCLGSSVQAQRLTFPDNADDYIVYAQDILEKTNNPKCEATAEIFKAVWQGGGLSSTIKTQVIQASQKMAKIRATPRSDYMPFYNCLINAVNETKISAAQLEQFLEVTSALTEAKSLRDLRIFFKRIEPFFLFKALHRNTFSRLYSTGSFEIKYLKEPDEAMLQELAPTLGSDGEINPLPEITGPVIRFSSTDIVMATPHDSTGVQGTKGVFKIITNEFFGKGGKFDWSSLDLDPSKAYCEFDSYRFNVSKTIIKAENVKLRYSLLLNRPVTGNFEFYSRGRKDNFSAKYPKFISKEANIEINQLAPNISYYGGFSLEGRNIFSESLQENALATLNGTKNGDDAFRIRSRKFAIGDSLIASDGVEFSLYLGGGDSLYHSNVQFKYSIPEDEIVFIRRKNATSARMPFINNYHKFYMNADILRYHPSNDSLFVFMLSLARDLNPAVFESYDFFDQGEYNGMLGLYNFHPLKLFTRYAQKVDTTSFYAMELAQAFNRNESLIRSVASNLSAQGFLVYDPQDGLINLTRRINQTDSADLYLKAVERIRRETSSTADTKLYETYDIDNFRVVSIVENGPNAVMLREEAKLIIMGIDSFPISEPLNVYIKPDTSNKQITVLGGRNFYMEKGEIKVGNFRFLGNNFFMLYDDFVLEMPEINQILFTIQDSSSGELVIQEYGGEIDFKPGRIFINDPLNKSGLKYGKIPGTENSFYESYPKLSIPQGGQVFFADAKRQNFAYDSTRSVFTIYEIDMDSLNIKVPIFPGKFESNIFPTFEEDLIPMPYPDSTMGYFHKPPEPGYALYPQSDIVKNAQVTFTRDLVMNQEGLMSGGKITYLTTTLDSPEFVFMPDSVTSDNIEFRVEPGVEKGIEFAEAFGKTAQLSWYATRDSLKITNKQEILRLEDAREAIPDEAFEQRFRDKLFTLYGSKDPMTLDGNLIISRQGLQGEGNLVRRDFSILSTSDKLFQFGIDELSGKNVEFRINSKDRDPYSFDKGLFYTQNKPVLTGNFVNVEFDLRNGEAKVRPDDEFQDFTSLILPYAEYRTSIKEAVWDLNSRNIELNGDSTSFFTSTYFGAEDFNEENLTFRASQGMYDINNLKLNVEGIPYINSADASIVPKDGKAVILKDAEMQELKEALVLIDTLNRYHRLFDGNIKIKSRLDFEGDATYQFVNVQKDTFNVKFDKFELVVDEVEDKKRKKGSTPLRFTFAQGTVNEEDNFYITSRVLYKGLIKMYANRRNLSLDGFIKLDLNTRSDFNEWIPYQSDKGDSVFLAVDEKLQVEDVVITSGLHFRQGSAGLYSNFLSPKKADGDIDVCLVSGILDYNPEINQFRIAPQEVRDSTSLAANSLVFDDTQSTINIQGKFEWMDEATAPYLQAAGSGVVNIVENTYEFDNLISIDFPINPKAIVTMQSAFTQLNPELVQSSLMLERGDSLLPKLEAIAGEKAFSKFEESIGLRPVPIGQISKELRKPFVFSKVNLAWSEEYRSFYSKGSLGLLSILDKIYDQDVVGFIEIRKNPNGDEFAFYVSPDPDLWYYFEFEREFASAISSDETFNELVESKGVELAALDKKEAFINKFRALYGAAELPKKKIDPLKKEKAVDPKKKKADDDDDGF